MPAGPIRIPRRRDTAILMAVALSLGSVQGRAEQPVAAAEQPELLDAAELLRSGKVALKEGRLDDAMSHFREGLRRFDDEQTTWQMLLGLALAHELKGDPVRAATYYQAFLSRSARHPSATSGKWALRRRSASKDVEQLEKDVLTTHALVTLTSDPDGAAVTVPGGDGLGHRTPVVVYLAPGQHQLEFSLDDHAATILVLSVTNGQRVTIQRSLLRLENTSPADPPPLTISTDASEPKQGSTIALSARKAKPTEPSIESSALPTLGWAMTGLGLIGVGAGVGFSFAAAGTSDELDVLQQGPVNEATISRDGDLRNELRDRQASAAAFYAGGGALALGGLLVLLLGPDQPTLKTRRTALAVDLRPTVGLGAVALTGAF